MPGNNQELPYRELPKQKPLPPHLRPPISPSVQEHSDQKSPEHDDLLSQHESSRAASPSVVPSQTLSSTLPSEKGSVLSSQPSSQVAPSRKVAPHLRPPNPTPANFCKNPGGQHEEDGSKEKGKIFSPLDGVVPLPSEDVTKTEDKNVLRNKNVTQNVLNTRGQIIPLRKDYGKSGTRTHLYTNYFQIVPDPTVTLWKYHIDIKTRSTQKKEPSKRERHRVLELLVEEDFLKSHRHGVVTDYNNILVTRHEIANVGNHGLLIPIRYWDIEEHRPSLNSTILNVTIKVAQRIEMRDFQDYLEADPDDEAANYSQANAVTALNIIVAQSPNITQDLFAFGGNRFYPYPVGQPIKSCLDLGGGLVAVRGYYASVRPSTLRVLINVHTITSAFYVEGSVWDLMRLHGYEPFFALKAFLHRLRVKTSYMRGPDGRTKIEKIKIITGLSDLDARTQNFVDRNGRTLSIETYFREAYGIQLSHPEAPVLQVGIMSKDKEGRPLPKSHQKPIYLPPELASIMPGQIHLDELSPDQTTNMLRYAARPPAENARRLVNDGLQILGLTLNNDILKTFGLIVKPEMITVPARKLDAPLLRYKGRTQKTDAGSWNLRGLVFAQPPPALSTYKSRSPWAILQVHCTLEQPQIDEFQKALKSYGLGNHQPQFHKDLPLDKPAESAKNDALLKGMFAYAKKEAVKFIVVVIRDRSPKLYGRLKFWADREIGIHVMCCVHARFQKKDAMIYANMVLKVNTKLGGTNHHVVEGDLGFLGRDAMIVGIDVTHPSPNSVKLMPSIAGVVANIDDKYSQWPGSIRLQGQYQPDPNSERYRPREMLEEIQDMMKERLELYSRMNSNNLPKKILVYRDGVSESQYEAVLAKEYAGIIKACRELYPANKMPPVSVLVVGKRHHTRFYPTKIEDSDLKGGNARWAKGNPRPGTVVDRGITMAHGFDFFLQSHAALQGAAKPAHYVIIKDGLQRSADEYQTVTHNLCYLFARATKAVSYCPPAYYADLLCERGRFYLHKYYNWVPDGPGQQRPTWDWDRSPGVQPHPDLADSMFYL